MTHLFIRFEVRTPLGQILAGGTLRLPEPETGADAYDGALRLAHAAELALLNLAGVDAGPEHVLEQPRLL